MPALKTIKRLRNCPFCGAGWSWISSGPNGHGKNGHSAGCTCCAAEGPHAHSRADAERLWNERRETHWDRK